MHLLILLPNLTVRPDSAYVQCMHGVQDSKQPYLFRSLHNGGCCL
jgi:hypothetical protein